MKIALRLLVKSPGFTAIALVTLALGIGVNTTAFTVLNRMLFFVQPYPHADRLVQIWSTTPNWQNGPVSPADFGDLLEQNTVFEHAALYYVNYQKSITEAGKPAERSIAVAVSADYFTTIGIPAALGRTFTAEEEKLGESPVVLSNAYWRKHFANDPKVLGRTLRFDGRIATIIGVMPAVLDDPQILNGRIDLWHLDLSDLNRHVRDKSWHSLVARLKPGATVAQAQVEVKEIGARLAHDYPQTNAQRGLRVSPYAPDYMGDVGRNITWLISALSATVLLIACVNLANLQLVRATGRSREYAIRGALGASRAHLIRLVLTESLLLSLVGGLLGLFVAKWGNAYFASFFNSPMAFNPRMLAFAVFASVATGVSFGAVPAWLASRTDVNAGLKQSGRGSASDRSRHRIRRVLIIAEVALSLTLLSGAGYFVRGIQRIMHRELHWRPENVLTGHFELPYLAYGDETSLRHQVFADKFLLALARIPGVDHVAISHGSPAQAPGGAVNFIIDGQTPLLAGKEPWALHDGVSPDYFDTYGIRLLQGRNFNETDRGGAPNVVIVNRAMAEKEWPGENPLGRTFHPVGRTSETYEVVGVVSDVTYGIDFVGQYPPLHFYRPWAQQSTRFPTFSVHSNSNVGALAESARKALASIEPDVALTELSTAEEALKFNLTGFSFVSRTLAELAGLGLLLSAVGIYGVIANLASERTQEIGIRMSLGAQQSDVIWLFLRGGITLAAVGALIGLLLSFGLIHVLHQSVSMMPGNDPWMVVGIGVLLIGVAVVACWLPARRATKVNPVEALRAE